MTRRRFNRSAKNPAAFNLSRLKRPTRGFDLRRLLLPSVDRATGKKLKGFETHEQAKAEKARRARSLENLAPGPFNRPSALRRSRHAARLGKLLRRVTSAKQLPSFANPLFMREVRRRLFGELLRLIDTIHADEVRIYTLIAAKWRFPASQLATLRPKKLIESLRSHLNKASLTKLSGWTIVYFHNEYHRTSDTYQPHFHVIVVGEKYNAFEALRRLKMFQGGKGAEVYRPVVMDVLRDPVRQLSYLWKGYWLQTKTATIESPGGARTKRPSISECASRGTPNLFCLRTGCGSQT